MAVDPRTLVEEWDAWRAAREQELRAPYGWLSLTALHWLPAREVNLPGVPGRWACTPTACCCWPAPRTG